MLRHSVLFIALFGGLSSTASAQLISIRTVPVSQAHQFDIFPSHTMGMGGISIAVHDSLQDPFSNPATGVRIRRGRVFTTPNAYTVTSGAGAGRSLPMGVMTRSRSWFGGFTLALQEVDLSEQAAFNVPFNCQGCRAAGVDFGPPDLSHGNRHAFATIGKEVVPGVSVGGSLYWSQLNAVDGVDLLYANSARVNQSGHAIDLRLGVLKEWDDDRSLEAIVLHNRYSMSHDVVYLDQFWDPGTQQFSQRPRPELNLDHTNTWGLHAEYQHPLKATDWRVGWLATINRASHPKIPNYELMNIPRDPGNSSAFNLGVGIAKVKNGSTFGVDLIYEPIWSHTWADSELPVATALGDTIAPGGMTIENNFRFSNALLRIGLDQQLHSSESGSKAGFQIGLAVRSIDYRLEQQDHVQISSRALEEQWVEWTPTWGLRLGFPEVELRYRGSVTSGIGRPGVIGGGGDLLEVSAPNSNILVAPSGPLSLGEVQVFTHQISISLPLR